MGMTSRTTLVHAQSRSNALTGPHFEVASVKPSVPVANSDGKSKGGGGSPRSGLDHRRFTYTASLLGLIVRAYSVGGCPPNADCSRISGGPEWMKKDRFEIRATMPEGSPD